MDIIIITIIVVTIIINIMGFIIYLFSITWAFLKWERVLTLEISRIHIKKDSQKDSSLLIYIVIVRGILIEPENEDTNIRCMTCLNAKKVLAACTMFPW